MNMEYWVRLIAPNEVSFQVGRAMIPIHIAHAAVGRAQEALWE